jgi:hypothetical protein
VRCSPPSQLAVPGTLVRARALLDLLARARTRRLPASATNSSPGLNRRIPLSTGLRFINYTMVCRVVFSDECLERLGSIGGMRCGSAQPHVRSQDGIRNAMCLFLVMRCILSA